LKTIQKHDRSEHKVSAAQKRSKNGGSFDTVSEALGYLLGWVVSVFRPMAEVK
jgi:hypothetical protein